MEQSENFYVQKKDYWLKFFHSIFENKKVHKLVVEKFIEPERIPEIKLKIQKQLEELLPQLPDFGRKKIDRFSIDMIKSAQSLAFYQVLKAEGFPVRTIGQIMFEITEVYYADQNPLFKYYMRVHAYSPFYHRRVKKNIEERNDSPHPEDYHGEFVEGDGHNLLFGLNYTNCAAFYLLQKHNALEIHPYLCLCDYPMTRAFNIGFNRDQNIAIGGEMCTFRIYRNYPTPRGWPPEEVPEYKDYNFAA
jgi:hypothetical protein